MTLEIIKGIIRNEVRSVTKTRLPQIVTTDATATLLFSVETNNYERGKIIYSVDALQDDGATGLSIYKVFSYKNDGAILTINTEQDILNDSDFSTAAVAANVNGTTIEVKVTGEASTIITWIGNYEKTNLNVEAGT